MKKEKALSEKDMIKRLVKNYTELKREYDKLRKGYAERVKKLKEEINNRYYKEKKVDGLHYEDVNEEIDKIMGNFNQDNRPKVKVPSDKLYDELYGDTHVKKDKGCVKEFKEK